MRILKAQDDFSIPNMYLQCYRVIQMCCADKKNNNMTKTTAIDMLPTQNKIYII